MFNGYQGPAEEIPFGDPLITIPANVGPYTPYSVHVTLAGAVALLIALPVPQIAVTSNGA